MITVTDIDAAAQHAKNMVADYLHQQGWTKLDGNNADNAVWGKHYKGVYLTGNTDFALQLERNMKS